ncbi:MAG: ArsR/SmtB family transcription factor [Thermoleophilia bacterium]|jgi:ArsR family transcriptional regulator
MSQDREHHNDSQRVHSAEVATARAAAGGNCRSCADGASGLDGAAGAADAGEKATAPRQIRGSLAGLTPFFKALGNSTRASIMELLLAGEACVCDLVDELHLSQPLVSRHLAILKAASLVRSSERGSRTFYSLDRPALDTSCERFAEVFATSCARATRRNGRDTALKPASRRGNHGDERTPT